MLYKRICNGVNDRGFLVPSEENTHKFITDNQQDWYESLFLYNEEQKAEFDKTGSVAGVQHVTGKRLYFDFDSKDDLETAANDTLSVYHKLRDIGFSEDTIELSFSGSKGFGIDILLVNEISVKDFKHAVFAIAGDFKTFDRVINNPSRVIRVVNTKHQISNRYKVQLTLEQLETLSIDEIKAYADSPKNQEPKLLAKFPDFLRHKEEKKKPTVTNILGSVDYSNKPKFLSNCRWALQNGLFKDGSRSTALLCLASTYKNLGYDQEIVYRMLKGVAELQSQRNDTDRFPDEEIYNNIIVQVFADSWKNGQYSCREQGNFLFDYCKSLGVHKCNHAMDDQMKPKHLIEITSSFKDYVRNIDKNTIITGISAIDENFFLSTGSNVGILGAPASGKTALALNILNNTSKSGVKSVFASLDMHRNRLFEKVLYKISGLSREDLYHKFQTDSEGDLLKLLNQEFGNVYFLNKSSPCVQDVREYVLACQEACGEKIKLVMVDYFERVNSDMSDDTAASKRVAGELQDLVNDLDVCLITLVQPNKMSISGGPDQPLYSYSAIKGSAFVSQAFRQILSIWRPFATPELKEDDRYLQMAILKNDLGELNEFVFSWNGKKGQIREMEEHEISEFETILDQKKSKDKKEDW